jgi:hypothetical protein
LQLRLLQTVVEVAAEKNSTLVMPFLVELLRFFDNASPAAAQLQAPAAETRNTDTSPLLPDVPALTGVGGPRADAALTGHPNAAPRTPAIR